MYCQLGDQGTYGARDRVQTAAIQRIGRVIWKVLQRALAHIHARRLVGDALLHEAQARQDIPAKEHAAV